MHIDNFTGDEECTGRNITARVSYWARVFMTYASYQLLLAVVSNSNLFPYI